MASTVRLLVVATALAAALGTAGCGNRAPEGGRLVAETEGIYLDINELKYQVQVSRYVNPADEEDRAYLVGLPVNTEQPKGDETWFGVWIRVQNETDRPLPAARDFEIHDTQEKIYRPVPLDPAVNPFVYRATTLAPRSVVPDPDSAAGTGPVQGSLLLFRLTTESLQNRPLELRISAGGGGPTAVVDLDI